MKITLTSSNTRWLIGELLIADLIYLVPVLQTGVLDEHTLLQGAVFATVFLVPAELFRLFRAELKFKEKLRMEKNPPLRKEEDWAKEKLRIGKILPSRKDWIVLPSVVQVMEDRVKYSVAVCPSQPAELYSREQKLSVFINAASEDREIAAKMGDFLETQGIKYIPPLDFASQAPTEIRNHLKANLEKSDVMILLLGDAPLEWIHQLSYCQRLATLLNHPIKWLVHSKESNKDFPNFDELRTQLI